jgi:hypothetical protein
LDSPSEYASILKKHARQDKNLFEQMSVMSAQILPESGDTNYLGNNNINLKKFNKKPQHYQNHKKCIMFVKTYFMGIIF